MSHAESTRRVEETFEQIDSTMNEAEKQGKKALDSARHAAAVTALWTFVTLLGGAAVAAGAACYGGSGGVRRTNRSLKEGGGETVMTRE